MMRINGIDWEIQFVSPFSSHLHTSTGKQALGCCDNDYKIIYISKGLNPIQLKITLYHEITHAVIYSYDIRLSRAEEEKVAQIISYHGKEIVDLTQQIYKNYKGYPVIG